MNTSRLGRGFDSLIPVNFDTQILAEDKNRIKNVLISEIVPNKNQPRKDFNAQAHQELVSSVKKHGVLQPLIVTREGDVYMIVAGERRFRAAKDAGLKELPVIIRTLEELERLEIAIIENVQRVDLSALEQALSVHTLHNQFSLSYEDIAARLGKAVTTIQNTVRLLQLPDDATAALREGRISEGHARAILALKNDAEGQLYLLGAILKNNWSVRQAEQFVIARKKGDPTATAKASTLTENDVTKKLSKLIQLPVKVQKRSKGGRLIIDYKTEAELQKLLKRFKT